MLEIALLENINSYILLLSLPNSIYIILYTYVLPRNSKESILILIKIAKRLI